MGVNPGEAVERACLAVVVRRDIPIAIGEDLCEPAAPVRYEAVAGAVGIE
jgi:hypothetical protein